MKIQCDVCGTEEASLLCCADEAALCRGCDGRVHSANKLAGKHCRLSLIHPSSSPPRALLLCDICKEKRGFVFCQQDRAILCRDCDLPIHSANAHTAKHSRFLLTGIMLSAAPLPSSSSPPLPPTEMASGSITAINRDGFPATEELGVARSSSTLTAGAKDRNSASSSISEYLTKMLPGWRVDDFLSSDAGYLLAEQAPRAAEGGAGAKMEDAPWVHPFSAPLAEMARERLHPLLETIEGSSSLWREEELSMVPQLEHHSTSKKRSRITSVWC